MQKELSQRPEIKLVGLKVRTSYQNELNWGTGKIFSEVQRYFQQQFFEKIPQRKNPGTTFCAYTDYGSDHTGEYTYFIGEEVLSLEGVPNDLETLIVPSQSYIKFTAGPGAMPTVLVNTWQKIWHMSPEDLGGTRRFHTDFEIYDERASDHQNIILDVYVGVDG